MKSINAVTRNPLKAAVVSVSKDFTTVKVSISRIVPNKLYGKRMHLNTDLLVDANGHANLSAGDFVEVLPCKKISKRKSWKIVSTLQKNS